MKTGIHNKTLKVGTNWGFLFKVKGRDLRAVAISIIIKRIGTNTPVFNNATDGTFSVTLSGADTVILWDIPYSSTQNVLLGKAYSYDMEVTEAGNRQVYIEGEINVERNR